MVRHQEEHPPRVHESRSLAADIAAAIKSVRKNVMQTQNGRIGLRKKGKVGGAYGHTRAKRQKRKVRQESYGKVPSIDDRD